MVAKFRVAVIELAGEKSVTASLVVYECSDIDILEQYFKGSVARSGLRRIVIVEWSKGAASEPSESSIQRVLEDALAVPRDFFDEHVSKRPTFDPDEDRIEPSYLPTAVCAEERWHLDFFDLWDYSGSTENIRLPCPKTKKKLCPGDASQTFLCDATRTQLQFHQWKSREGWLVIAPRKCSYWSASRAAGWDVVLLCDPPPNKATVAGSKEAVELSPLVPFRGGYREFIPRTFSRDWNISESTLQLLQTTDSSRAPSKATPESGLERAIDVVDVEGKENSIAKEQTLKEGILTSLKNAVPPRTSLFDDMRYYFSRYSSFLDPTDLPCCATLFPLKLIASHYSLLHAFVSYQTASMRSTGWAVKRETPEQVGDADQVETAWSRFRCSEYLEAIESLLDVLGIAYQDDHFAPNHYNRRRRCELPCCTPPDTFHADSASGKTSSVVNPPRSSFCASAWKSPATDFLFLYRQFSLRRQDYNRITTSIAALAGIVSGRLGVTEARTAKTLTYVAMCFAPLAWVTGLYSMTNEFAPGQSLFWNYWATAIPVTFGVWLLFSIWQSRKMVARTSQKRIEDLV